MPGVTRAKGVRGLAREQKINAALVPAGVAATAAVALYAASWVGAKVFTGYRQGQLREMLLDVVPVLERLGSVYWIDFGTLLGLHRQNDLIEYDNDVDVVVVDPHWPTILDALRAAVGSKYRVDYVHPSEDPSQTWIRVTLFGVVMLDLYGAHLYMGDGGKPGAEGREGVAGVGAAPEPGDVARVEEARNLLTSCLKAPEDTPAAAMVSLDVGRGEENSIPARLVFPLGCKHWRGRDLPVPGRTEAALVWRYGEDWRVPKYLDKGRDSHESKKLYYRLLSVLGRVGLRF